MQTKPDPGNLGLSHPGEFNIENTPIYELLSVNIGNSSSTSLVPKPTVLIRLQKRKRVAISQPKELVSTEDLAILLVASKGKSILQKKKSQKKSYQRDKTG